MNRKQLVSDLKQYVQTHKEQVSDASALLQDKARNQQLRFHFEGMFIDASKQLLTTDILHKLNQFAENCNIYESINRLFRGDIVNPSENRAALHTLLRSPTVLPYYYTEQGSINIAKAHAEVHATVQKMQQITRQIHTGQWRGFSGRAITDVVNLGVGGSELGPNMVVQALAHLKPYRQLNVHFASSMDGSQLEQILPKLHPETTIFIYSSKSFSTIDTASNAQTALAWLCQNSDVDVSLAKRHHFIGVSTRADLMTEWGIHPDHQLMLWDWVGGRFSLWSAIGLPIALKLGMDGFKSLLKGAYLMDEHFRTQAIAQNIPIQMALYDFWNFTILERQGHAVLPYDGRLRYLPNYLTQLEMESNGKSKTLSGADVDYSTCPILWGDVGSNAQHAFFQLLHQGTSRVALDFIAPVNREAVESLSTDRLQKHASLNLSNCLAQSRLLFLGDKTPQDADTDAVFKEHHGGQPSTTILLDELSGQTLGQLLALYEHKVYALSVLWDINPFDQWGVEKGKVISKSIQPMIDGEKPLDQLDDSTHALMAYISSSKSKLG